MGVSKRGPIYHYKFDYKGKTHRGTCRTSNKARAQEFEQRVRENLSLAEKKGNPITIEESLNEYLTLIDTKNQKETSLKRERSVCNRLMGRRLRKKPKKDEAPYNQVAGLDPMLPVHQIDYPIIINLLEAWKDEGLQPDTQRQILSTLRRAIEHSGKMGNHITDLDFKQFEFKKTKPKRRFFTFQEERDFLDALKESKEPINYHLSVMLFDTGARVSEMLSLTWDQLTDDSKKLVLYRGKTENSDTHTTVLKYTERMTESIKHLRTLRNLDSDYVFRARDNLSQKAYSDRWFNEAAKRINLNPEGKERLTIHSHRRTYASRLLILNLPLKKVSVLLGHSNTQITESKYAHLVSENANNEATSLLNDFNKGPNIIRPQEDQWPDFERYQPDGVGTNPSQNIIKLN